MAGVTAWHLPVEIAVVHLDGQVVIGTPTKHNQPISELLGGDPSAKGGRTRGTMQRIYGRGEETWRMTWDDIRQTLLDAGMNRNSCLIEWSKYGIDHKFIRTIMGQDTPSNPMWLITYWRAILPGFSSMALSYFHSFIRPNSDLPQFAHQAVFDCFMLINAIKTMLDLAHRGDVEDESQYDNAPPTDEQILQSQE